MQEEIAVIKSYLARNRVKKFKKNRNRTVFLKLLTTALQTQSLINECIVSYLKDRHLKINGIRVLPDFVPSAVGYWEVTGSKLPDNQFQTKYRLGKNIFTYLCNVLGEELNKNYAKFRDSIPVPKRIIIALHVLKSNSDISTVCYLYKVEKSIVEQLLEQFCNAIIKTLYKKEVNFPLTEKEREDLSELFLEKYKFPNTFGCLDGTHIAIKKPSENGEDYFNYKYYSINLLALVDDKYCFRLDFIHLETNFSLKVWFSSKGTLIVVVLEQFAIQQFFVIQI